MTPEQRQDVKDVIAGIYSGLAHDIWGDETPDDDEFADVMIDLVAQRVEMLEVDTWASWAALSYAVKVAIALEVGP